MKIIPLWSLLKSGKLDYIVYTGKSDKKSIADYIKLFNRANQLGMPHLPLLILRMHLQISLQSRYNQLNTELVDINNNMRNKKVNS